MSVGLIEELMKQGYTHIIYEFDKCDLRIPLESLITEIPLAPVDPAQGMAIAADDESEDVPPEAEDQELAPETLRVAYYDVSLEQTEVLELTQRETDIMDAYVPATASYWVRLGVLDQDEMSEVANMENAMTVTVEDETALRPAHALPEDWYPQGVELLMMPLDDTDFDDVVIEGEFEGEGDAEDDGVADETVTAPTDYVQVYMSYEPIIIEEEGDEAMATQTAAAPDETMATPTTAGEDAPLDLVETQPAEFAEEGGMIVACARPVRDGIYFVGTPEGLAGDDDEEGTFEDLDTLGGNTGMGQLSTIGSSFSLDENGNPVYD